MSCANAFGSLSTMALTPASSAGMIDVSWIFVFSMFCFEHGTAMPCFVLCWYDASQLFWLNSHMPTLGQLLHHVMCPSPTMTKTLSDFKESWRKIIVLKVS